MNMHEIWEPKIQRHYQNVPDYIRDDICEAAKWARDTLTQQEGSGHCFYVTACHPSSDDAGLIHCSFAKPSWAGDHCSRGMEGGSEAMVMAVCEYMVQHGYWQ